MNISSRHLLSYAEADKLVLLAFIDTLSFRINAISSDTGQPEVAIIQSELASHINTLRSNSQIVANKLNANDWQKNGTEIWNVATRLGRKFWTGSSDTDNKNTALTRVHGLLRAFAFLLLDCAYRSKLKADKHGARHELVRLLRTANKAAKTCLNTLQLELCTAIFERAADLDVELSKLLQEAVTGQDEEQSQRMDEHTNYKRLQLEYCALRVVLVGSPDGKRLYTRSTH